MQLLYFIILLLMDRSFISSWEKQILENVLRNEDWKLFRSLSEGNKTDSFYDELADKEENDPSSSNEHHWLRILKLYEI